MDANQRLLTAARQGNLLDVERALGENADIETQNRFGNTPLMLSASNGHTQIVQILLNRNANINARNVDGYTALTLAATNDHTDTVELLIERGADINIFNADGDTLLTQASMEGNIDTVRAILNHVRQTAPGTLRAYVNQTDRDAPNRTEEEGFDGMTALIAVSSTHTDRGDIAQELIDAGTDINARDSEGKTALMYAAENGNQSIVTTLIDHPDIHFSIHIRDNNGHDALYYAEQDGNEEIRNLIQNKMNEIRRNEDEGLDYVAERRGIRPVVSEISKYLRFGSNKRRTSHKRRTSRRQRRRSKCKALRKHRVSRKRRVSCKA